VPPHNCSAFAGTVAGPDHSYAGRFQQGIWMRSLILWLIGVPIPIIIILWLVLGGP
jgi:hypothetical protein